jgi:hypothetical protein
MTVVKNNPTKNQQNIREFIVKKTLHVVKLNRKENKDGFAYFNRMTHLTTSSLMHFKFLYFSVI